MQKDYSTREEYDAAMSKKVFGKEDCPFCDMDSNAGDTTIWKGKYWYIKENIYPYSGNNKHVMVIPYAHKRFNHELEQEAFGELKLVYTFLRDFYGEQDYFSCTRESMGNRSVEHLHMHFIPGKLQGKYLRKMLEIQGFPIHEDITFP